MSFKPIETQEELDAIIAERIARAKKTAVEPFADYEDVKAKNATYESEIAKLTEQLREQSEKLAQGTTDVDKLNERIKQYETASVKTRIAHEVGIPFELAEKLTGEDEETIRADANRISKYLVKPAAPIGEPEPAIKEGDAHKAALMSLVSDLKGE